MPNASRPEKQSSATLRLERRQGIVIVTIARPGRRNALSLELAADLMRTMDDLERDPEVRAIILTGEGDAFCAGAELGSLIDPAGIDHELQFHIVREFNRMTQRMRDLDLPIIGAINGPAVGGGAALALACDIAVASEKASYYFAFGRVGAAACDMACAYLLPKIVGTVISQHWFLTGATVGADEGLRRGLFVDVVPPDRLLERALEIGASIAAASPRRAAAISKQVVLRGQDADFQTCAIYEGYVQSYLFTTEEHKSRLAKLMSNLKMR